LNGARRAGSVMLTSGAGKTHRPRACRPVAGGVARWNAPEDVSGSRAPPPLPTPVPRSSTPLPGGQPLPRDGLQQLQLGIMRGTDVLDLPRPAMAGAHDLRRDGARCRPDRPQIRHRATLRPLISAQIQPA
jgi:hypothetical protein